LDGGKVSDSDPEGRIYLLPGEADPEAHVFAQVLDRLDAVAAK
jgi:hypothetical protein